MPAYYFSLLTRQLALGEEAFLRRYPNSWLVWEAGGTPGHLSDAALSVVETGHGETRKGDLRPGQGDALCFVLKAPDGELLHLGRALDNELIIAEPTVSRLHAALMPLGEAWHLMPLSEKRQTVVAGRVADPREVVQLHSGQPLELGGVRLTFYDAKDFKKLVSAVPLRSSR
jgi:L-ascorbate metabolism protein UlaG (beta-lactamase superfamily)